MLPYSTLMSPCTSYVWEMRAPVPCQTIMPELPANDAHLPVVPWGEGAASISPDVGQPRKPLSPPRSCHLP